MEYLNRDHPVFRDSPRRFEVAVRLALQTALRAGASFRLRFDPNRALKAAGVETLELLIPDCSAEMQKSQDVDGLVLCEEQLNSAKAEALMLLMSFELQGRPDLPVNYVQTLRVNNGNHQPVYYSTEMNEFILLSLPADERTKLLEEYGAHGIPPDVLEPLEIDPDRLKG